MKTSFIRRLVHSFFSLSLATVLTTALASIFSTQMILAKLINIGADVNLSQRLSMTVYDMMHFGSLYGLFIFIAFIIAFLTSHFITQSFNTPRRLTYILAGGVAIAVMLWLMKQVFFGVPIVGGARDTTGLILQILAGMMGGAFYETFSRPKIINKILA